MGVPGIVISGLISSNVRSSGNVSSKPGRDVSFPDVKSNEVTILSVRFKEKLVC